MKRVLVAGGAGFIGSHLIDLLITHGYEVVCMDNLVTGSLSNLDRVKNNSGFQFVKQDVCEKIVFKGELDFILNLASPASPIDYAALAIETLKVGSLGTLNLLELAKEKKALFLLASTSEVYGDPKVTPQKESYWGNVNPIGPRSMYDEAKRFAEALTVNYHKVHGVPVRIARIFNTYGPRMRPNDGRVVPNFISQALKGEPLTVYGDGSQTRSFCYVSDLVEGLYKLMLSDAEGPVNLGNPQELKITDFAKEINKLFGRKEDNLIYKPLPEDDPMQRKPDIGRAKNLLGWEPGVGLEEGLSRAIEYFKHSS
ncbi:MAG: SDR family oxidoreductase [Candidatus Saganbacteria bacterium]|nr:SDR family oxidoreductase [Candidatus Saganbacteria bacterium]